MNQQIIIITHPVEGKIAPVSHELISAAFELRQLTDLDIKILMTGPVVLDDCKRLSETYGIGITVVNTDPPSIPDEIGLRNLPASLFDELNPAYIVMAHNTNGCDAAPGLAVKINAACITGVEKISSHEGAVCFTRSIFNDKITERITSCAPTTIVTLVPGIFKPDTHAPGKAGEAEEAGETKIAGSAGKISSIILPCSADNYQMMGFKSESDDTSALDNADVIVSAGNGIKEEESLDLIFQLANLFPKSAVAGSRPICDKKWLKYSHQVGITGATVSPKLYIACGISGSSQHISGMRDSRFIVSINTDPHAAIFNVSDVCIIEDLTTFIPQLLTAYHEHQSRIP